MYSMWMLSILFAIAIIFTPAFWAKQFVVVVVSNRETTFFFLYYKSIYFFLLFISYYSRSSLQSIFQSRICIKWKTKTTTHSYHIYISSIERVGARFSRDSLSRYLHTWRNCYENWFNWSQSSGTLFEFP